MLKFFQIGFIIGFFSFLIFPLIAMADGGMFPPPDFYIRQSEQKAVIFYDGGVETLIISVTFQGNAKNFGWVVPTPARPEIGEAPDELFTSLRELTEKYYGREAPMPLYREMGAGEGVEVLETKEIGIFEAKVLTADDAEALAKWLSENKYQFPKEGSYVLENYVKNKWYFVAVKVRPELVWGDVGTKLRSGHATPLKLIFQTKKIIYPMKISALNKNFEPPDRFWIQDQEPIAEIQGFPSDNLGRIPEIMPYERKTGVLLYVFADKEKRLPGFAKQYAEIIEPQTIEDLAYDSQGDSWTETDKSFVLTKLYRSMSYNEMTDDLILRDVGGGLSVKAETGGAEENGSAEDSIVPWAKWLENSLYFLIALFLWLVSPVGFIFLIASAFQFLSRLKMVRIVAWFFQGLSILLWIIAMICLVMMKFAIFKWWDIGFSDRALNSGIVAGAFLMVAMIAIMVLQIILGRKKVNSEAEKQL